MGKWRINGEIIELPDVSQDAPENVVFPALFKARPDIELKFNQDRLNQGLKQNPNQAPQEEAFNMPTQEQFANIQYAQPMPEGEVDQFRRDVYGEKIPQQQQQPMMQGLPGRPKGPRDENYGRNMGYNPGGTFGTPEQKKQMARDALGIAGGYASLIAPGLFNGVKGAGAGLKIAGEMGTQGLIGALSDPEHALEQGLTAAGMTGAFGGLGKFLTSTGKPARWVKDRIAPAASATAAFNAARAAGADYATASAAAALAYQGGHRYINPKLNKSYNARKYAEQLGPIDDKAIENFKKAEEYGVHLTPAQASGRVGAEAVESKLGTSVAGAEKKQAYNETQRQAKKNAVEKLNKRIYDEGKHDPLKQALYDMVDKSEIPKNAVNAIYQKIRKTLTPGSVVKVKPRPPESHYGKPRVTVRPDVLTEHKSTNIIDSLTEAARKKGIPMTKDPNVQAAINNVLNNAAHQKMLKGIPDAELYKNGKFMKLVRQEMGDMYEHYLAKPGGGTKADAINKSIKEITPVLDEAIPGFKKARELHERSEVVNTIRGLTKKGQPHGETLAKYLNNSDNKKKLLHNMRNVKGADKHINDLHEIFKRTENVTDKELANAISDSFSHAKGESKINLAKEFMKMFKDGAFDEAAVNLTYHKNWPAEFKRVQRLSSTSKKMAEFMRLLSRPTTVGTSTGVAHLRRNSERE